MKIALGQINTTVGDLTGNVDRMIRAAREAAAAGAQMVVFPELSVTGYPPRDLVEKPTFVERSGQQLERLATETAPLPLAVIAGYVGPSPSSTGKRATNCAAVLAGGKILFRQTKMLLPTYDVFDEARYFVPAESQSILLLDGRKIALTICEDAWNDKQFWERPLYRRDPVQELAHSGAELLISINASPYHMGKRAQRREIFEATARRHGIPLVYVNQVGGQHDNLAEECEAVYEALVLGTRDYIRKCGFERVLIGLSGGIDSSLTAAIAVDALGPRNVTGVGMPGPFSSEGSIRDARALAENLGIRFEMAPISPIYDEFLRVLDPLFAGARSDVTEENLQARLRGVTLMALSNKWGALVLTTGNKSELAVGYCTLYGDMCGGLAVISDVPKTLVYELSRTANRRHPGAIPESVFEKPPSAELRADQKDSDSLPPYEILDQVLRAYVEDYQAPRQIARDLGLPLETVVDIVNKVDRNEYKRQQAAPGLKVTSKAFGIGRRFPIAQKYAE